MCGMYHPDRWRTHHAAGKRRPASVHRAGPHTIVAQRDRVLHRSRCTTPSGRDDPLPAHARPQGRCFGHTTAGIAAEWGNSRKGSRHDRAVSSSTRVDWKGQRRRPYQPLRLGASWTGSAVAPLDAAFAGGAQAFVDLWSFQHRRAAGAAGPRRRRNCWSTGPALHHGAFRRPPHGDLDGQLTWIPTRCPNGSGHLT